MVYRISGPVIGVLRCEEEVYPYEKLNSGTNEETKIK